MILDSSLILPCHHVTLQNWRQCYSQTDAQTTALLLVFSLVFGEKQNFTFQWEFWHVKINMKSRGWGIKLLLRTAFMQTRPSRTLMCQRLLRLALPDLAVYLSVCLSISTWITSLTWLRVRQVLWQPNGVSPSLKNGLWECLFLNKSANSHLFFFFLQIKLFCPSYQWTLIKLKNGIFSKSGNFWF